MCVKKPNGALFTFSLLNHYNSTCFGLASNPSSGGSSVFYVVRTVHSEALFWSVSRYRTQETRTNCRFVHVPLEDGLKPDTFMTA
jgi:hypothetical protein